MYKALEPDVSPRRAQRFAEAITGLLCPPFGYNSVNLKVVCRDTWTPKVCRIMAFCLFPGVLGYYLTYFCPGIWRPLGRVYCAATLDPEAFPAAHAKSWNPRSHVWTSSAFHTSYPLVSQSYTRHTPRPESRYSEFSAAKPCNPCKYRIEIPNIYRNPSIHTERTSYRTIPLKKRPLLQEG